MSKNLSKTLDELEQELIDLLDAHDALVVRCLAGALPFREFESQYDTFYMQWALDGHESPPAEQAMLARHNGRIHPHARIWREVICHVTSDELALQPAAVAAGLVGSTDAVERLRAIANDTGLLGKAESGCT